MAGGKPKTCVFVCSGSGQLGSLLEIQGAFFLFRSGIYLVSVLFWSNCRSSIFVEVEFKVEHKVNFLVFSWSIFFCGVFLGFFVFVFFSSVKRCLSHVSFAGQTDGEHLVASNEDLEQEIRELAGRPLVWRFGEGCFLFKYILPGV